MATTAKLKTTQRNYSGQTMLVITAELLEKQPVAIIQKAPHFWLENRLISTEKELPENLSAKEMLEDYNLCWDIGWKLYLDLIYKYYDESASILSIQTNRGYPVIRYDQEPYEYKNEKQFITKITLPTITSDILDNDRLLQATGKIILENLLAHETQWPPVIGQQ